MKHYFFFFQSERWFGRFFGNPPPSKTTICWWFVDFRRRRTAIGRAECIGSRIHLTASQKPAKFLVAKIDSEDINRQCIHYWAERTMHSKFTEWERCLTKPMSLRSQLNHIVFQFEGYKGKICINTTATTICLQMRWDCLRKTDLIQIMQWFPKLKRMHKKRHRTIIFILSFLKEMVLMWVSPNCSYLVPGYIDWCVMFYSFKFSLTLTKMFMEWIFLKFIYFNFK